MSLFNLRVKYFVFLIGLLLLVGPQQVMGKQKKLKFCTLNPPSSRIFKISQIVLTQAFHRLGYKFELVTYPAKRAPVEVNKGNIDGDAHRIYHFNSDRKYPNLIRVEEPIQTIEQSIFTKRKDITVNGWHSLRPYRIIYVSGVKLIELELDRAAIPAEKRIPVFNHIKAMELLANDRGDLVIISPDTGILCLKKLGLLKTDIKLLSPPLIKVELYPYMNSKHRDLAQKLADTLREMKQDGSYQAIINMKF